MLPLKDIMSEIRGSIFPIFLYSLLFVFPQSLLEMDATSFPSLVASLSAHHLLRLLSGLFNFHENVKQDGRRGDQQKRNMFK